MPCTLKEELLPPKLTETTKPQSEHVMSVWVTDKGVWRSFRIANVIKVEELP